MRRGVTVEDGLVFYDSSLILLETHSLVEEPLTYDYPAMAGSGEASIDEDLHAIVIGLPQNFFLASFSFGNFEELDIMNLEASDVILSKVNLNSLTGGAVLSYDTTLGGLGLRANFVLMCEP